VSLVVIDQSLRVLYTRLSDADALSQ